VTRHLLWIAVGREQLFVRDGSAQQQVAVHDGVPDVPALAAVARGRRAHVLVGPSLAQVRRVGGPACALASHDAAGVVANHMEDTFVGVRGDLVLVQCSIEGGTLWAWAVPGAWRHAFAAACRTAGLRIETLSPLSRIVVPDDRREGDVVACVDGAAAAVVKLEGGHVAQEWRAAAPRARGSWDVTGARTLEEALVAIPPDAEPPPLAAPSASARLVAQRRRQLGLPMAIAVAAFLASAIHPEVARVRELRALRAERAQLDSVAAGVVIADSLLRLLDSHEVVNARVRAASVPLLSLLAAAAHSLDDDGLLLSVSADTATATFVVTVPSTAAVLERLMASRLFGSVRISGDIVRIADWRSAATPAASGPTVPPDPSAPRSGLTPSDAHMERATFVVAYRTTVASSRAVPTPARQETR
jgi:hypothetical protein